MKLGEALENVSQLLLDTAPVIYYVENHPQFYASAKPFFDQIDDGSLVGVTSPITLAECLIIPKRTNDTQLQQNFQELIIAGNNTLFVSIDHTIGITAADLRARYNLTLTDALQLATALAAGCEAFLTNDTKLKRVTEVRVLVLAEITPAN